MLPCPLPKLSIATASPFGANSRAVPRTLVADRLSIWIASSAASDRSKQTAPLAGIVGVAVEGRARTVGLLQVPAFGASLRTSMR